jgi:hypothetical protein
MAYIHLCVYIVPAEREMSSGSRQRRQLVTTNFARTRPAHGPRIRVGGDAKQAVGKRA